MYVHVHTSWAVQTTCLTFALRSLAQCAAIVDHVYKNPNDRRRHRPNSLDLWAWYGLAMFSFGAATLVWTLQRPRRSEAESARSAAQAVSLHCTGWFVATAAAKWRRLCGGLSPKRETTQKDIHLESGSWCFWLFLWLSGYGVFSSLFGLMSLRRLWLYTIIVFIIIADSRWFGWSSVGQVGGHWLVHAPRFEDLNHQQATIKGHTIFPWSGQSGLVFSKETYLIWDDHTDWQSSQTHTIWAWITSPGRVALLRGVVSHKQETPIALRGRHNCPPLRAEDVDKKWAQLVTLWSSKVKNRYFLWGNHL